MVGNYYELFDNMSLSGRWHLKGPVTLSGEEIDPRIFTAGKPVDLEGPLRIPLRRPGEPMDFTLADFGMPVLRTRFVEALAEVAPNEIQRFPAFVDGQFDSFEIVNVVQHVDCLDHQRTGVTYWTEEDGLPDLVGRLQTVVGLKVDLQRAEGHDIFRIEGWEIALVVSARIKEVLQHARGAVFEPV
jgi:hypothetical protein